ncbi:MAG: NfeD family protein [Deltaproteobacteria bacterium]|nr:NfeD family protein [Deltaproteobacteria bacterium]
MDTFSDWAKPELIWFIIGLILLLMELALPGLVMFFFGVGAWIVSLVCFAADISLNVQLITFLVSSLLLLAMLRSQLKSLFYGYGSQKEDMSHDMDELIGETARVIKEIGPGIKGRVELHGTGWDAKADEKIVQGAMVKVVDKESITLKVKKI